MRPRHCFLLAALLAASCGRTPPAVQPTGVQDSARTAEPSLPRPLAQRLLGNWSTKDPGRLRAFHFQAGGVVAFVLGEHDPTTFGGAYRLAGRFVQIYRGPQDNIDFEVNFEVVDCGEDFLLLRDPKSAKPQRFTRE